MHHLFIAVQSCWQNCRSMIGIYSFPLNWVQPKSESIIDPFRQIPWTEWCRGLAVSAIALFTSYICKPENGCINCTKPLITAYNFLSYCKPFPNKGFHFLFSLLTEIQSTVDHNLFTVGERIHFKYMKTSHYFNTHTRETKPSLSGNRKGLRFQSWFTEKMDRGYHFKVNILFFFWLKKITAILFSDLLIKVTMIVHWMVHHRTPCLEILNVGYVMSLPWLWPCMFAC